MTREELITSREFNLMEIEFQLWETIKREVDTNPEFEKILIDAVDKQIVSKRQLKNLLENAEIDIKLSNFVEFCIKCGYIPKMELVPISEWIERDKEND